LPTTSSTDVVPYYQPVMSEGEGGSIDAVMPHKKAHVSHPMVR